MRLLASLRLILICLVSTVESLFWSIVMMALIFYLFGALFVQNTAGALKSDPYMEAEIKNGLLDKFGSVQGAMLSLFQTITGGEDWSKDYVLVKATGYPSSVMYLFFIAFTEIAFMNILTGLFIENALKQAQPDRSLQAIEHRKQQILGTMQLEELCKVMDTDTNGKITVEEFTRAMLDPQVQGRLVLLGLDIRDTETFFRMIVDGGDDLEVYIEDFVNGCMKLKGEATSLDIQVLMFKTKLAYRRQKEWFTRVSDRLQAIEASLAHSNDFCV